jgi:transposase-like protein
MSERVIDVIPGLVRGQESDGRSKYDPAAKAELVRRCREPGVSVAAMALAHGLNANLLRKWMTDASRRAAPRPDSARLLPVTAPRVEPSAPAAATPEGGIELVLPGGTIRIRGAVEAATLATVIDCLSRRS